MQRVQVTPLYPIIQTKKAMASGNSGEKKGKTYGKHMMECRKLQARILNLLKNVSVCNKCCIKCIPLTTCSNMMFHQWY